MKAGIVLLMLTVIVGFSDSHRRSVTGRASSHPYRNSRIAIVRSIRRLIVIESLLRKARNNLFELLNMLNLACRLIRIFKSGLPAGFVLQRFCTISASFLVLQTEQKSR